MEIPASGAVNLTTNERYIYGHFLHHYKHRRHSPCFVPISPRRRYKLDYYLKALERLEAKGLISLERITPNYSGWIIKPPTKRTP